MPKWKEMKNYEKPHNDTLTEFLDKEIEKEKRKASRLIVREAILKKMQKDLNNQKSDFVDFLLNDAENIFLL